MADFKELLRAQKETTDALRSVAVSQGQTLEVGRESLSREKSANKIAGGIRTAETKKANALKKSKGETENEERKDSRSQLVSQKLFKKMSGSLTGILGSFKAVGKGVGKGIFAALKGLALGGLLLALSNFFDDPRFKKLTKKLGEIGQSFGDVYTAFAEEGFLAGIISIKDNFGNLALTIGALGLLFAPFRMFKGIYFLGKVAYSGGKWAIGKIFKGLFKTNLFGKAGVFRTLYTSILGTFSSMKGSVLNAAKRGVLGAKNIVNSLRGSFGSFFGKGGALRTLASNIGTTAKGLLNRLTTSTFVTKIADKFASFFGKTGALRTFASKIGTTASNLTSRLARAVKTGLFAGKTSILSKFGSLFSSVKGFGTKLATSAGDMAARLAKSVSLGAKGAIGTIGSKFTSLFTHTAKFATKLGTAGTDMAKRLLSSVSLSSVKGAAGAIASKFTGLFTHTASFATKLGTAAKGMLTSLTSSTFVTNIASKFTSLFTHTASFGTKVADVAGKMLTKLTSSTFVTNIANKFTGLFTHTASFVTKLGTAAKGMLTSLTSSTFVTNIASKFTGLFAHTTSFASNLGTAAKSMAERLAKAVSTGAFSPSGIASKFKSMFGVLGTFGSKLGSLTSSATSALGSVIKSTIAALPASIKNIVKGGMGTATKLGTKALDALRGTGKYAFKAAKTVGTTVASLGGAAANTTTTTRSNKPPKIDPKKMAKLVERFPNLGKLTKYLGKVPVLGKLITGGLLINILMKGGKPADMAGDIGGLFGAVGGAALGGTLAGALGLAGGPLAVITGLAGAIGGGFAGDALGRALGQFIVGINPIDAFGWPFNWVDDLLNGGMAMMGAGGGSVSDMVSANVSAEEMKFGGGHPDAGIGMSGGLSGGKTMSLNGSMSSGGSAAFTGKGNNAKGYSATIGSNPYAQTINIKEGDVITTNNSGTTITAIGHPDQQLSNASM